MKKLLFKIILFSICVATMAHINAYITEEDIGNFLSGDRCMAYIVRNIQTPAQARWAQAHLQRIVDGTVREGYESPTMSYELACVLEYYFYLDRDAWITYALHLEALMSASRQGNPPSYQQYCYFHGLPVPRAQHTRRAFNAIDWQNEIAEVERGAQNRENRLQDLIAFRQARAIVDANEQRRREQDFASKQRQDVLKAERPGRKIYCDHDGSIYVTFFRGQQVHRLVDGDSYSTCALGSVTTDECAICTEKFRENQKIIVFNCHHAQHIRCLSPGSGKPEIQKCPHCRAQRDAECEDRLRFSEGTTLSIGEKHEK